MSEPARIQSIALGVVGAALGGVVGCFVFFWAVRQGFYALVLPPALLGFGAGLSVRQRIQPFAIACGVAGLALGLFIQWKFERFVVDDSFSYFLTHLHQLRLMTLIMLALGTYLSYHFALGRDSGAKAA